jgi:hypothetical protein
MRDMRDVGYSIFVSADFLLIHFNIIILPLFSVNMEEN